MADASFDVVVIGGGHQGLIAANYMIRNGYTVGLFEQRRELGGGGCTESRPISGFIGNPCAHVAGLWASPVNQDFKLHERGLNYIFPRVHASMVYPDERCIVSYRSFEWDKETGMVVPLEDVVEKNIKEVERISPRDADVLARWQAEGKIWEWGFAAQGVLWSPPALPDEIDPVEMLIADPNSGIDRRHQFMTATEYVCDLFESDELRAHSLRMLGSAGIYPDEPAPLPVMLSNVPMQVIGFGGVVYEGGTHNAIHAFQRALSEEGGKFFVGADVDEIIVENGRATGIKLADGTRVEAKKMVITSIVITQTMARHLRNVDLGPKGAEYRRKIAKLRTDTTQIFWGQIAFHELPQYRAAAWNPDCGEARWIFMGDADIEYLDREYRYRNQHIRPGQWPERLYLWEGTDSKWDPRYAPPGKHVALLEEMAFPASWRTEEEWMQIKKEAPDHFLKQWQRFAPNMTWDNVIAANIDTPWDIQHRSDNFVEGNWGLIAGTPSQWGAMRPIPEFAQYQIPGIEDFWMASGSCHYSLGMVGWAGYNCYKRIAQKHDLWKPWEGRLF
ncbi:MAG: NAD(P)/FAD-dependent oxidoreductase [Dehalococcoidia bacterium]|nr:MAG: NAD(P)/FAD-dependent oxidoreductase [Dehalococcoidia bacterium]